MNSLPILPDFYNDSLRMVVETATAHPRDRYRICSKVQEALSNLEIPPEAFDDSLMAGYTSMFFSALAGAILATDHDSDTTFYYMTQVFEHIAQVHDQTMQRISQ